jgi:hypothetical protein
MQEVFKMKRSCNCYNTGKGRRCGLCNDREKRLANVPRGLIASLAEARTGTLGLLSSVCGIAVMDAVC